MARKKAQPRESRSAAAKKLNQTKRTKTWANIARLAGEALAALDAGKVKDVRAYLAAIRGVALSADQEST